MKKYLRNSKKGFTLIELMFGVAIIGILAAIAIPNFLAFQLRARSSEGKTNIAAIRTAQESYQAEFGTYLAAVNTPTLAPNANKQAFIPIVANGGFDLTGFSPEGLVYFQYAVASGGTNYTVDANADIDGDLTPQTWGYLKPNAAGTFVVGVHGCDVTDLILEPTTVGPCAAGSGASVF